LRVGDHNGGDLRWDPLDPRSFVDDLGTSFEVRVHRPCGKGEWGYSALLQANSAEWSGMESSPGGMYLVVRDKTRGEIRISFGEATPACQREQELFCTWDFDAASTPRGLACGKN
jgi:hypothetical protein